MRHNNAAAVEVRLVIYINQKAYLIICCKDFFKANNYLRAGCPKKCWWICTKLGQSRRDNDFYGLRGHLLYVACAKVRPRLISDGCRCRGDTSEENRIATFFLLFLLNWRNFEKPIFHFANCGSSFAAGRNYDCYLSAAEKLNNNE